MVNFLFVPINDSEINSKRIENELKEANFSDKLSFDCSYLGESIEIPTGQERAAPWHICPVTEEFGEIGIRRCYTLNYCLMYVIDEIEKLSDEYQEYDFFVLIFPNPPAGEGGFHSLRKGFLCVENDIENIVNQLSVMANQMERETNI